MDEEKDLTVRALVQSVQAPEHIGVSSACKDKISEMMPRNSTARHLMLQDAFAVRKPSSSGGWGRLGMLKTLSRKGRQLQNAPSATLLTSAACPK